MVLTITNDNNDDYYDNQTLFIKTSLFSNKEGQRRRRIDIKLFRRPLKEGVPEQIVDAAYADAMPQPTGKLPSTLGYYGMCVYPKQKDYLRV